MSYFFTNYIRQELFDDPTLFDNAFIEIVFFRQAPTFENGDSRYTGIQTLDELLEFPGWETVGDRPSFTTAGTVKVVGKNNYVLYSRVPFTALDAPIEVKAMALIGQPFPDDIIFVSTSPFLATAVISPQDGLTSNPDIGLLPGPSS